VRRFGAVSIVLAGAALLHGALIPMLDATVVDLLGLIPALRLWRLARR